MTWIGPAVVAGSYLLGGLCAGYFVVRGRTGRDIRRLGSGTAGARNAGRVLGGRTFALVFALDAAKGASAVLLAWRLGLAVEWQAAAALAVTAGHIWPCWLGFRGGKGAACAAGALLVFCPLAALIGLGWCALAQLRGRHPTSAALVGVILAPLGAIPSPARLPGVVALAMLVLFAHRRDLARALRTTGDG